MEHAHLMLLSKVQEDNTTKEKEHRWALGIQEIFRWNLPMVLIHFDLIWAMNFGFKRAQGRSFQEVFYALWLHNHPAV